MAPLDGLRRAAALVYTDALGPTEIELGPADSRHLLKSLRLRPGAEVAASDGRGRYRLCRLTVSMEESSTKGRGEVAAVLEPQSDVVWVERAYEVAVGFSLVKGERPDWAVAKLTEIGVGRIMPLVCERTIVRPEGPSSGSRAERLARVAREAGMQSRQVYLPRVEVPRPLAEVLAELVPAVGLAEPGGESPGRSLRALLVGPEGGFTRRELEMCATRVTLGDSVLRTETAAVVAGALLGALRSGTLGPTG